MVKHFLWDGRKPRINMDKLCQPKNRGGLSLPNIKYCSISFEMSKLVKHWKGINTDLDWVLIEQELTSPFKPIEAPAQVTTNKEDNVMNPILLHSKAVWREVHKKCQMSHNTARYAPLWHNPKKKNG